MKRILTLATFLLVMCGVSLAQYAVVAHTAKSNIGVSSAIDTTGATLLVVECDAESTTPTLIDSKSNVWQPGSTYTQTGYAGISKIFYSYNPIVGTGHTFTCSNDGYGGSAVLAISGTSTASSVLDGTCKSISTGITISPTVAGDILVAMSISAYPAGIGVLAGTNMSGSVTVDSVTSAASDASSGYLLSPTVGTLYQPSFSNQGGNGAYVQACLFKAGAVAASLSASPSTIPAGHSGNITLTLTGTGTSWVSGTTTFSVTGGTKVSQTVTSSTAATVVVTTSTAGTLTVSDGTASGTVTVATPTLAISPTTGTIGTTPTVTLTGTNTLWSSETASTLFSVSGGTSSSIGSISVTSNTAATATLTTGSVAATETVTDNSTAKTATVTVSAGTAYTITVSQTPVTGAVTGNSSPYGSPFTYSLGITPPAGYSISGVTGCNGSGTSTYTGTLTGNCTAAITYAPISYAITTTVGSNGTMSCPSTVAYGSTGSCTVTPNSNYTASVSGCGGSLSGSTFTWTQGVGGCTVTASFTASATGGGTILAGLIQ